MLPRRVTVDNVDEILSSGTRVRRFRGMRLVGLLFIGGLLAFGLWKTDLFGAWAERGGMNSGPTTTFYLGEGATIMDRTQAVGATWYLIVQPTTDNRLCYQIGDQSAKVVFSCTGAGLPPMAKDAKEAASVVIPPLAAGENAPPVIMGAVASDVARIELRANDVVQKIAPVDWPEIGRSGFIAPIDPNLARQLPAPFTVLAFNADGACVGAFQQIPSGTMVLADTKACPKR